MKRFYGRISSDKSDTWHGEWLRIQLKALIPAVYIDGRFVRKSITADTLKNEVLLLDLDDDGNSRINPVTKDVAHRLIRGHVRIELCSRAEFDGITGK